MTSSCELFENASGTEENRLVKAILEPGPKEEPQQWLLERMRWQETVHWQDAAKDFHDNRGTRA